MKRTQRRTPTELRQCRNELSGAARIAPLLALMSGDPVESAVAAARAQTALTHGSQIAGDAAEFLTRIVFAVLAGAPLRARIEQGASATYDELNVRAMLQRVEATRSLELAAAAKSLGLACRAASVPDIVMLLDRCGDRSRNGLIENANAAATMPGTCARHGARRDARQVAHPWTVASGTQSRAPPGRVFARPPPRATLPRMNSSR